MPIKIFENTDIKVLEAQINKFVESKKVLHTSMSAVSDGNKLMSTIKHQVLVYYQSETGSKRTKK